ncbi:MAG: hypothetical protein PVI44_13910, partial [Balneolaceae bacterium]
KDGPEIVLKITDDGIGIPENTDLKNPQSLGIKLIKTLSKQLCGEASFKNMQPGTEFLLVFELEN